MDVSRIARRLTVSVEEQGGVASTLTWTYTHVGIDEDGRRWVRGYGPERFDAEMSALEAKLTAYLAA